MRITIRMESHPVHDWFPPDNEMASHVARLCILREDWWLEFNGHLSEDDFKPLDSTSQLYRRLYFLRSLVTTLTDIHETIRALNSMECFRKALAGLPEDLREAFQSGLKFLNQNQATITKVRNNLGGHVSHNALQRVLRWINGQVELKCAIANDPRHMHFYFAESLCASMLFHDSDPTKVMGLFTEMHTHTHAVIHGAFAAYISTRGIMP